MTDRVTVTQRLIAKYGNPWALTTAQEKTLIAYCRNDADTLKMANAMGLKVCSVYNLLNHCRVKMGQTSTASAALLYQRWRLTGKTDPLPV